MNENPILEQLKREALYAQCPFPEIYCIRPMEKHRWQGSLKF